MQIVTDPELARHFHRQAAPLLPELHQRAWRLTRNHHDAEDLVQDTVLNAFRGYPRFSQGTNFRAWMYRIELNTFINEYRKAQRRPQQHLTAEFTDAELADTRQSGRGTRSAEEHAIELLPNAELRAAFLSLPEQFRTTVYYADVAGYTFREIAELTDVPMGTVMSRLHRGRKQLRLLLTLSGERRPATVPAALAG
ncbi:sigma-70 family RNA polymerase sigma factor [Mycolicibacterium sp. S2-37]|uniref:sigma-70 family RNA polymerase sigma factor n=1 Tax=Mycolicibacterium sp. S2-37 TaxID=2810297 RepID=UPI001A93F746|nr:sigma-70 family RNA polymerase sigma factor [Mycolicibacterium sp. S2-37]MBO0679887.1 sigma-70 family RNA polymerase sigma factor [Mycolicibacterium sp. S2-37]